VIGEAGPSGMGLPYQKESETQFLEIGSNGGFEKSFGVISGKIMKIIVIGSLLHEKPLFIHPTGRSSGNVRL